MDDSTGIKDSSALAKAKCVPREPLLFAFWFVCGGVLADYAFNPSMPMWIIVLTAALSVWWLSWMGGKTHSWLPLGLAIAGMFGAWHHLYWNFYPANQIASFVAADTTPVCVRGVVLDDPQNFRREDDPISATMDPRQATFKFKSLALRRADGTWQPVSGHCEARVRGHVESIAAGDQVTIFADLSKAGPPMNPGAWNPSRHARMQRLLCRLDVKHPGCMTADKTASAANPRWWVPKLRATFQRGLLEHIDGPAGGLAVAVLLGAREHVAQSTIDSFLVTGTVHLLAISGLHVGILAFAMLYAMTMLRLPRTLNLYSVMLFCLAYACLTGGRAPVIRATVIVWVACLGLLWYRPNFSFNSLAAAGILVLAINPAQLFAPGAQLSFVAVAAIIWIVPRISDATAGRVSRWVYRNHKSLLRMALARRLRKSLTVAIASIVIWFVALPLVMLHFHLVAPIALVLNIFAWIPLTVALLAGFVTMLFAWLPEWMVAVPASICQWSLEGLTAIVGCGEQLPGSHFWLVGPPRWSVIAFYVIVAMCLAFPILRRRWQRCLTVAALVLAGSWMLTGQIHRHRAQPLEMTFLAVGHGTCVILQLPGESLRRRFWIYDAGRLGTSRYAVQEISNFLWSRGASRIEGLMLSHADVDHFNAIPGLANRFSIGTVYTTGPFVENRQPAVRMLMDVLGKRRIRVERVSAGNTITANETVQFRVLHPHPHFQGASDNEQSVVVSLDYQGQRILLPGDLEGAGMERLLSGARLDCDLVMAPHHGSQHSAPDRFCAWSTPEWVVISGGHARGVKKGKRIFENHGAKVLQTTEDGAIEARIDDGVLRVSSFRFKDW